MSPVLLAEEWRNAILMPPDSQRSAMALVPPGASLRFSYGRQETGPRLGGGDSTKRPTLTLSVMRAEEQVLEKSFTLPGRRRAANIWQEATVELDELAGESVEFNFSFTGGPAILSCALASPRLVRPEDDAPTVVLITSDTHRSDHLGAARNGTGVATPVLDQLASEGVLFEDCFSSTNITLPSHASILTGLPVRDTGMVSNSMGLAQRARSLAEVFSERGWFTMALFSAQHLRHGLSGLGQGFDRMRGPTREGEAPAAISISRFDRWIASEEGVPVFIWLHVFDAHAPYEPPEELRRRYYAADLDPFDSERFSLPPGAQVSWAPGIQDVNYIRGLYKAEVTNLDRQIGALLDHPRVRGSILAFTSDHGEVLGNHDLYFLHQGIYPDTLSVPLILRWPGCEPALRVGAPVSNTDVGRTLLDLAGLSAAAFPGTNLLRWTEGSGEPTPARHAISSGGHTAAIEYEGWLLLLHMHDHESPTRVEHQVELFNLNVDPACDRDLVDAELERSRALRADLIAWLNAGKGTLTSGRANSVGVAAELAALGYVDNVTKEPGESWYEPDPQSPWCQRFDF